MVHVKKGEECQAGGVGISAAWNMYYINSLTSILRRIQAKTQPRTHQNNVPTMYSRLVTAEERRAVFISSMSELKYLYILTRPRLDSTSLFTPPPVPPKFM
jgi:hypothetical protein